MTLGRLLLNLVMCDMLFEWSPCIDAYFRALCLVLMCYYSFCVVIVKPSQLIILSVTNVLNSYSMRVQRK